MKILLVDDNPDITGILSTFLKVKGFENVATNDPRVGLEKIKNNSYDVIFLDIQMPELSGLEIIDALEIENILKDQNIIIFSTKDFTTHDVSNLLKKDGIEACLQKPIQLSEMLTAIVR
jgi:DNA-binding response OmpR family regulator